MRLACACVFSVVVGVGHSVLGQAPPAASAVLPEQEKAWLNHLIPLPKEVRISRAVSVAIDDVAIRVRANASDVEKTAQAELVDLLRDHGAADPGVGRFEILIGVSDDTGKLEGMDVAGVRRLSGVPNHEQAYVIRSAGDTRLLLSGLNERGVYYAVQTLRQLLDGRPVDGRLRVPLADVTDWPDLAERGEWGGSANGDTLWFAQHKLNLIESHAHLAMTEDGRGKGSIEPDRVELARRHAVKLVPIMTHLDQLAGSGLYTVYPELRGKGKSAQHPRYTTTVAPCLTSPKIAEILADWMRSLAASEGVTDICAWLTEHHLKCACDECAQHDQYVLEARALVGAWRLARRERPDLRLRILLTQGSYTANATIIAETPPEVGITYYDGGRTYDSSREPMIYPLLEDYAASGRWLGCYPQLTASWRIVCPWTGPQFIRSRMNEFVDKKLSCLCGYATPHNRLYDFNVTAAAEWSWNAKGRDERQFALAWATRRGLPDPEAVADWAVMIGPVGWDVYGSRIPYSAFFGSAAAMIPSRVKPVLGEGIFRYFSTIEHMDSDLRVCGRAMAIVERLGDPAMIAETRVLQGYVRMIRGIYRITTSVIEAEPATFVDRVALQDLTNGFILAGLQTTQALRDWEAAIQQGIGGSRFQDTVNATRDTFTGVADSLAGFGIRNPVKFHAYDEVGAWETKDFERQTSVTKTFEVTKNISGPGDYEVFFKYASGWWGASPQRAALYTSPANAPEPRLEVTVDAHPGTAAYASKDNIYVLTLDTHEAKARYFLTVDINGVSSRGRPSNRQGCNGTVQIKRAEPTDWEALVAAARPLTDEELSTQAIGTFSGKGLRVGVVQGGYGSTSILAYLQGVDGIDAQPVFGVVPRVLSTCQVLVLPQSKAGPVANTGIVQQLRDFVASGGGLIVTHDAVGDRGFPVVVPDVCPAPLERARDPEWRAVGGHPVTAGLEAGRRMSHTYYDHIELESGPNGVVVARAGDSGRPVVVCGPSGKGRFVACGLALGLGPNDRDVAPGKGEDLLLTNAVNWCGGK